MNKNFDRIQKLVNLIVNGHTCIFAYNDIAPETFTVDIAGIFKADMSRDVLRNVLVGDEEGLSECDFVVIPEPVDSKDVFVKLADYVNGIGMEYAFCYCKDKDGYYKIYEIDLENEYVEGGYEPHFDVVHSVVVGEQNVLFISELLNLGVEDLVLPSPTLMFIEQGEHYTKHLIGPNDEELVASSN